MPLYIRYPSWATSGASITINGKKVRIREKPGSYISLNHTWKAGDKVDITFPMSLHLVATNDNPDIAAVLYGPVVLAGDMGTEGMNPPVPFARDQLDYRNLPIPDDIVSTLRAKGKKPNDWLVPMEGNPLAFKTSGVTTHDITLIPYYRINRQRYVIYWNLE